MKRLIRKALLGWEAWKRKRRLHRQYPWLAELDRQEAEATRRHVKVSDIRKARRDAVTDALRGSR